MKNKLRATVLPIVLAFIALLAATPAAAQWAAEPGATVRDAFGPQAGFNFHLGDRLSLVLSSAYNYKWGWSVDTSGFNAPLQGHRDHYISVNLALLFRSSGDVF